MTSYVRVIGVDVSSKKLDISDSKGELSVVIDNTVEAIKSKLAKKISGLHQRWLYVRAAADGRI